MGAPCRGLLVGVMVAAGGAGLGTGWTPAAWAQTPHVHKEIEKPDTIHDAAAGIRQLLMQIDAELKANQVGKIHDHADGIRQYARLLGRLAVDKKGGIRREQVGAVNGIGKELAAAAIELHDAPETGNRDKIVAATEAVRVLAVKLDSMLPQRWVCDMHCRGCETLFEPGTCPVCKMAYRTYEDVGYSTRLTARGPVKAGEEADLRIRVVNPAGCEVNGSKVETVHEHPMHAIFVSNDLSWYAHEHPVLMKDGTFGLSTLAFPAPGKYTLFADFTPRNEMNQVSSQALTIPGEAVPAKVWEEDFDVVNRIDGYEFRIRCNGQKYFAGEDSFLRYGIDRDGQPVKDLQPLMGAMGHLVAISADLQQYVHAHPLGDAEHDATPHAHMGFDPDELYKQRAYANGNPSDVVFYVRFPTAGIYRLFAQFKHKGKVILVPFTVDVLVPEGGIKAPTGKGHEGHGGAKVNTQ